MGDNFSPVLERTEAFVARDTRLVLMCKPCRHRGCNTAASNAEVA